MIAKIRIIAEIFQLEGAEVFDGGLFYQFTQPRLQIADKQTYRSKTRRDPGNKVVEDNKSLLVYRPHGLRR